jgi:hypothetical protein
MPLPTMSLRASPEYHQLIRDIATALRTRPELANVLRDVLQSEHGVTERDTDALQSFQELLHAFQERLMIVSDGLQRINAYADNINERLKALEQERAIAQPAKARSRGRARDAKTLPPE